MSEKIEALQTPLPDLLDQVPDDIVLGIPGDEPMFPSYTYIPIGKLARLAAAELRRFAAIEAQRDALKQTLHDELAGNLRLRDLGGARPDEPMLTFLERIIAERDALLAALKQSLEEAIYPSKMLSDVYEKARAAIAKAEGK